MAERLAEVVRAFGVSPDRIRRIGGRADTHWRVASGAEVFVLRRYADAAEADASAAWEAALVADLAAAGVPVPIAVTPPRRVGQGLFLLTRHLEGRKLAPGPVDDAGYRRLGRLLAGFHAVAERLPQRPQRPGWTSFAEAAEPTQGARASLLDELRRAAPEAAPRLEAMLAAFEARDLPRRFAGVPRQAIHSDFSPWNLLVRRGALCGVLDFELAHLDVAAADVAFARRGYHDAVVDGYLEARPLPEAQLADLDGLWLGALVFTLWQILAAWRRSGRPDPADLDWHLQQLDKTRAWRPAT
ncbi:MAG TPA: phosphotransferase [Caulobacteraceae bacterium]|nr:phosphotransferase [Caulobacteraceae bacterium]